MLGDRCGGRDNHFTAIRIGLAMSVALAHAWITVIGPDLGDPFRIHDLSISYMAVNGFFVLSGFFIAKSLDERCDLAAYAISRGLRIMPGLFVLALFAAVVFGPLFTALSWWDYVSNPQALAYPLEILFFTNSDGGPPGIFAGNPAAGEFSAPLWTLRYEVLAYIGAGLLFALGLSGRKGWMLGGAVFSTLIYICFRAVAEPADFGLLAALLRFSMTFLFGMAAWSWRADLPLRWEIALILTAIFLTLGPHPASEAVASLALGYVLLWAGVAWSGKPAPLKSIEDVSYGLYIWHYPVMQTLVHLDENLEPVGVFLLATPITMFIALLSWRYVESPCLSLKRRLPETRTSADAVFPTHCLTLWVHQGTDNILKLLTRFSRDTELRTK